jgi:hypothetical protein
MNAKNSMISRSAGLMAGTFVALASAYAAPAPAVDTTDFGFDNNFIKMSYSPVSSSGNKAAFQAATQMQRSGAGGIEELRFGKDIDKDIKLQLDAKVMTATEDYLGKIKISKEGTGSLEAGYSRFRTFYDGIGGFFPTNGAWMPLADQFLHVDRQKVWAEFNYKEGDGPAFKVRYENNLRTGKKDSTIWGQTDNTGIPNPTFTGNAVARALTGSYIDLNERTQTLQGSVIKVVGNTTVEAGFIGNKVNNEDTRYYNRYPGELKPYPAITKNIQWNQANNAISGVMFQGVDTKTLSLYSKFETKVNDKVTVFGGVKWSKTTGSAPSNQAQTATIGTKATPITGVGAVAATVNGTTGVLTGVGRPPYSYSMTDSSLKDEITAGNVGVNLKPMRDLYVTAALKAESENTKASNNVTYTTLEVNPFTSASTNWLTNGANWSREKETSWTPELNFRYTGIRTVAFYGAFDYRNATGTSKTSNTSVSPAGLAVGAGWSGASDNTLENHGHYKLGASWTPCSAVVARAELFEKDHVNSFLDMGTVGDGFAMSYKQKGGQVTVAVTPFSTLTLTTKVVSQKGTTYTSVDSGTDYQSNDTKTNLVGETIDWTPVKDFYFQGNVNVAFDSTITSYPKAGGMGNWVLHNADNDYWNGSVMAGMVIDKNTDGQVQYTYYKASNYKAALAWTTLPYGAAQEDSMITVGVKHKFTDKLIGEAKVGYVHSVNATTGGNTNYNGTIGYVSLAYAF